MAGERSLGFLAERLDEAVLRRETALVADEARERVDDQSLGTLAETKLGEVFPEWHPYHREFGAGTLGTISLADVRAFLRTWYTPRNATLVVAGRFEPAAILALVTRYFADLPATEPPARPQLPPLREERAVQVEMRAGVIRPVVVVLWPAPAWRERGDAELDIASALLTGRFGRLRRELVSSGLAVRVGSRENSLRRGSAFAVEAIISDGKSADEVAGVIERAVRDLARQVLPEECARAREEWASSMVLRLETSLGRAHRLAGGAGWSLAEYAAIQPSDVERALKEMLARRETVVVVRTDRHYRPTGVVVERKARTP